MSDFKLPESLAFKADDIRRWPHVDGIDDSYECIARHVNALLTERLAKLETVYVAKGEDGENWVMHGRTQGVSHLSKILPPWPIERGGRGVTSDWLETMRDRIRTVRYARRLTQKQLGKMAHVAQSTIAQVENGVIDPSLSTVFKLCEALEIEPLVLFAKEFRL